jgi:hypothetical protein
MSHRRIAFAAGLLGAVLSAGTAPVVASEELAQNAARPETKKIVAGREFDRGGSWRFWFGEGYRKAWTTPAELPVLDLKTEAGGLAPLRQVGGLQTVGLAMKGANGRGFTFRKLEKHPERVLPEEWQDSELRAVAIDQTAAAHPAATAIIGSLAQSVGILFYASRLVVMPDDPALGEFRGTFGGAVGTFDEYLTPGYQGITEVISSFDLWKKWREGGPENRVDSRAFLKARLFDLVVGNWDRHQAQWRWARIPGKSLWEPLPEDADQAFTRYEGKVMGAARKVVPRFMRYSGEYPPRMEGLTTNNYDVTRWLLADVEWPEYQEVAQELKEQMTDTAIDEAMRQMPPEWYAIDAAQMAKDVRQRRDGIVEFARKFYLHLADRVDVRATDQAERADLRHLDDGSLELTLAPLTADGSAGAPFYRRRFSPKETQEIRLYLLGGNDRLVTSGPQKGGIHVRVLGDAGNDTLDDSKSGGADLQDSQGSNTFLAGPGTKVSEHEWKNPAPEADRPWLEPRNYGHWTVPVIVLYWEPNQQVMAGGGFSRTAWGFRKYPWANMQALTVLYSTGYRSARASYSGQWRINDSSLLGSVKLRASGVENLNFFGFGNEAPNITDKRVYKAEHGLYSISPALSYQPSSRFELHVGAEAKLVSTKGVSLVEQQGIYGTGTFGELGLRVGFELDSRGRSLGLTAQRGIAAPDASAAVAPPKVSGVRIVADSIFVPKAWDVTKNFGGVDGSLAGYLGNQRLVLATRVGGRRLWGPYPWFESASISGTGGGVRGYYDGRFRGDSSLFGNAELRFWLGHRKNALLPLRWGLTAFCESGRVWYASESSNTWHTGYGGGIMTQLIGTPMALGASIASGTDGVRFYFSGGYSF